MTWTKKSTSPKLNIGNGSSMSFSGLNSLNFNSGDNLINNLDSILQTNAKANLSISDVGDINFGSTDKKLLVDQGIHAFGGTVDINNINNFYANATGAGFLMAQNLNDNGIVNIQAKNDINIETDKTAITSATYYNNYETKYNIEADNKINIKSNLGVAIFMTDTWGANPGNGNNTISINGHEGVNISSLQSVGLYTSKNHAGEGKDFLVDIKSDSYVNISGGAAAIYNIEGNAEAKTIINVNAPEANFGVTLSSSSYASIDSRANSELNFNVDELNISAANNKAVNLSKGANAVLGNEGANINIKGNITVDDTSKLSFADNSTTYINAEDYASKNFIIGKADNINVKNARLFLNGAKKGVKYNLFSDENTENWSEIKSDNPLLIFTSIKDSSGMDAMATYTDVSNVVPNVATNSIITTTLNNKDEGDIAYDFFNGIAINNVDNLDNIANAYNSVANMGELGGINHSAYSVSNIFTDSVVEHLSLGHHDYTDNDIWAKYIHNKEDISDVKLGGLNADYDAYYNGFVVGGDLYSNGKTTAGVAFSYVDGNITGRTLTTSTKNDANYYGLSFYGKIDNGDSALISDISYLHGSNDLTQYNSGTKITASPDTDAFSIGWRAEKLLGTDTQKFVPYIGVRYMHLGAGDYTNSLGMKYDVDDQNLVLSPIGVKYSADINHNDWTVRPMAELGYMWNFGDKDIDQTISLNSATDKFGFNVTDDSSFIGKLGVEMENDNVVYGVGYEYQKGDTLKSNRWVANATFKF